MTVQSSGANSFVYSLNGSVGTTFGSNSSAGVLTTTSNNPLNLGTNASTRMTILATVEVGVGTTSPARMFQVAGAARLSPTTTPASPAAGDVFIDSGASNSLKYHNGTGWVTVGSVRGDFLANGTVPMTGNLRLNGNYLSGDGGSEGLFVDSVGRVGVGLTNPATPLHIYTVDNNPVRIENITPSGYSQLVYQGTGRTFQTGVGNASETILA